MGKGTLPAQHTTFNTLDNWAIKNPPNQKGPERKGYRVMARNMYTVHSVTIWLMMALSHLFKENHLTLVSFYASLQAVHGVMSLALCLQVVSQAPQHFRSSELEANHLCFLLCPPVSLLSHFLLLWHVQESTPTGVLAMYSRSSCTQLQEVCGVHHLLHHRHESCLLTSPKEQCQRGLEKPSGQV